MEAASVVVKLAELPGGSALLAAAERADRVWLVGGSVRDLLLGRTPNELDVVVEGPLQPLLDALGGASERFEQFGTATVDLAGARIDLAEARSETYSQPGALPEVQPAPLEEDLQRRDFTINAIAVSLADAEVKAAANSLADLEAGLIRVLHDRSFSDDPTRVWRCARYAARLGFAVDAKTAALAAAALPGSVSGERVGNELRLALDEQSPTAVFTQLQALNERVLVEGFDADPDGLAAALEMLGDAGNPQMLTLAACCTGVDADLLRRWLDHLQFTADQRETVLVASRWVTRAPLRAATKRSQIARAVAGAPAEAIALAGGENARLWFDELADVRLEISGDDLIAAGVEPGPQLGAALAHALDLTLDGQCSGAEQQLAAALEQALGSAS